MKRVFLTFSFLFFTICVFANVVGQYPVVKFTNTNIGSQEVSAIIQNKDGDIIVGGQEGLVIYKANNWENYKDFERPVELLNLDKKGQINIAGKAFFGLFEPDTSGIDVFKDLARELPDSLTFENVANIVPYITGTFFQLDKRILLLNQYLTDFGYNDVLFSAALNENVLIQREGKGLFLFAGNDFKKINNSDLIGDLDMVKILSLPNGKHLFVLKNKLVLYDGSYFSNWPIKFNNELRNLSFTSAVINSEGVFLGTSDSGILQLDIDGNYIRRLDKAVGLHGNNIVGIFQDTNQNLWTWSEKGIAYIRTNTPIQQIPLPKQLNTFGSYIYGNKEQLFFGTESGLFRSTRNGTLYPINGDKSRVNAVHLIDNIPFLNSDDGFFAIVGNQSFKISPGNSSNDLIVLPGNELLLEANTKGLGLYEKRYGKWRFLNEIFGVESNILELEIDERQQIWANSQDSKLYQLIFNNVLNTIEKKSYLLDGQENKIYGLFTVNGKPIVCSSLGIYEYNQSADKFEINSVYESTFGSQNHVIHLYQDEEENIWFISETEAGLIQINDNGVEKKVEKIIIPELFPFLNLEHPHIHAASSNEIYFAGKNGFVYVDSRKVKKADALSIQIYKFQLFDDNGVFQVQQLIENNQLDSLQILPLSSNNIKLFLNSNYLNNENLVHYQYKVDDSEWSSWSTENIVDLELTAGKHIVSINAKIGQDQFSENVIKVPITITQLWYTTDWARYLFYAIGLLIFIFSLMLMRWFFRRKLRNNLSRLQEAEAEKEKLKLEKNELLEKNSILSSQLITSVEDNNILEHLKQLSNDNENEDIKKGIKKLIKKLKIQQADKNENLSNNLIAEDPEFITRLKQKFPELTKKDIKLSNYLKLDLTSKEIAPLLGITMRGVEISRYRLRKKLELRNDIILSDFLKKI